MTTDEQLIERIQSSMNAEVAGLVPPRELLEAIRALAPRWRPWVARAPWRSQWSRWQ